MGMLVGTVGALSTFYPEAKHVMDLESRRVQTRRLIGKMPTIAAYAYRHSRGLPYVYPDNELSYTGNFLSMLFRMTELKYKPDPVLEHALDVLFILHADHEQNCSTTAARVVGSAHADPYSVVAAAAAALSGPRHGGANEEVVHMLREIGSIDHIPELIKQVKAGERRLMGFGHRVYKNYDPRAKIIKEVAHAGLRGHGQEPADRHRARAREDRARRRLLRQAQALPERRLLLGHHLRGDGLPGGDVPGPVRDRRGRRAGWRSGPRWCSTRSRRISRPKQLYIGYDERVLPAARSSAATSAPSETEVRGPL